MNVARFLALRIGRLYPSFLLETESTPGIMSMKISNDTTGNRTRDLPVCSGTLCPNTTCNYCNYFIYFYRMFRCFFIIIFFKRFRYLLAIFTLKFVLHSAKYESVVRICIHIKVLTHVTDFGENTLLVLTLLLFSFPR